MTAGEQLFIGLAFFGGLVLVLCAATAIARLVLGSDPDLAEPWDPRR